MSECELVSVWEKRWAVCDVRCQSWDADEGWTGGWAAADGEEVAREQLSSACSSALHDGR